MGSAWPPLKSSFGTALKNVLGLAELVAHDFLGVWSVNSVHRVVNHGEIRSVKKSLDGAEIKNCLQKIDVRFSCTDNLDTDDIGSFRNGGNSDLRNVDIGKVLANIVSPDFGSLVVDGIGHLVGGRPSVFAVVLDSEIFLGTTGVVTGGQDEGTECLLPHGSLFTDSSGDSGCAHQSIFSDPHALDTVGNTHLDDGLDGFGVEVSSISSNEETSL